MIISTTYYTKINIKPKQIRCRRQTSSLQLLPKSAASISGTFVVYSGILQVQGLSSWLWGSNLLLLRLHWEIPLSLLRLHNSWGSVLVLAPPLHVGQPQTSVPCPDRRGLKQQLIRALLLIQARRREGYGSHNWNVGWACSSRGQRDVATGWGALCVLLGKLSLDLRTLAVACCRGSWGGVDSDLRLHTGFLVPAAAALAFHARPWGCEVIATAHACLWSSLRRCSAFCGHVGKESTLLAHPETKVSCLSGRSRLFPGLCPS